MNFSAALLALKAGQLINRSGWNGKGMYLFLIQNWNIENASHYPDVNMNLPFIAMKTADNKIVPWLASQTDILAEDWEVM